jgi:2-keto-4-pentenoate hydratase/2-oxohepta-3-ene-1,7-dioic acid hydratase in catechol pathway
MRLVTFTHNQEAPRIGALVENDGVVDLQQCEPGLPGDLLGLLAAGQPALDLARRALSAPPAGARLPLGEVILLAPIPRPGKILCLGHNYYGHTTPGQARPAEFPTIFAKLHNTIIGPGQTVVIPPGFDTIDYEAELAVVIGRVAKRVSEAEAMDFVSGYTILNDVSSRQYQNRTSQWMMGKNFDTFGPLGPAIVTKDEIADPHNLELSLTLNGLELQRSNTRQMIFSIPYLVAYLSAVMTLEPGDLISTGTPAKTEAAKTVPPYMHAGDVVTITIEGLGELTNRVVSF